MADHFVLITRGTPLLMRVQITRDASMKRLPGITSRAENNCVEIILFFPWETKVDSSDVKEEVLAVI